MANVKTTREVSALRRYLTLLSDTAESGPKDRKTIGTVAREMDIRVGDLRAFRDGKDAALNKSLVRAFVKLLGTDDGPGIDVDDTLGFADPSTGGWYGSMLAEESIRHARLRHYQLIDRTRPEAHSALDAWADLGVTGNIGEDARHAGGYEPVVKGSMALKKTFGDISDHISLNLLTDDVKIQVFRGMVKYGDQWGCLTLGSQDGKPVIDSVSPRHASTMYVNRDAENAYDPTKAYKQCLPGRNQAIAYFPEWQIAHFANRVGWGDVYGTSIFDPCLRSYLQIEAMEAAMIIRRLERASMRLKFKVDIGMVDEGKNGVKNALDEARNRQKKAKTVDHSGNRRIQKITMPAGEDIFIPKRDKDSPSDVEVLEGDGNIGEIADFNHFFSKFLAGLGPPKAHLGYESETMRSVITDLHIVFARKVRRMQLKFIHGLNHLYWVSLILRGIDPRSVKYAIFPPPLGTRDELVRAQVQLAHATTVQYLAKSFGQTGKQPSIKWLLTYVMGFDTEVVESLQLDKVIQPTKGAGFKNDPNSTPADSAKMATAALGSEEVQEQIEHLHYLIDERKVAMHSPDLFDRFERAGRSMPFVDFDDTVRRLGVKELRSADAITD